MRWLWWIYIAVLHLLVIVLIAEPGRKYVAGRTAPIRFAWLQAEAAPELGLSREDVEHMMGPTRIAVARLGEETIASFHLENGELDSITFRWPGRTAEHGISESGSWFDMHGEVLSTGEPPETERFFIDRDGDGLLDVEARNTSEWRAMLRAEWVMVWRADRETGRYEFFGSQGSVVARATPDNPSDTESWTLERLDGEHVTGTERIEDAEFDLNHLVDEFGTSD